MDEHEDLAARRRKLQRSRARFDRVAWPALIVALVILAAVVVFQILTWSSLSSVPVAR